MERGHLKEAGGCFQPESYCPKGGASSLWEGRALGSLSPHTGSNCPSPDGRSKDITAEPWAVRGLRPVPIPACSASMEGPGPSAVLPRLTYSIKEVSELVLLKTSSQKVIWGLQDTFFEPKGGRLMAHGEMLMEHCCTVSVLMLSPTAPNN